jgi:hypothetical protein
MCAMTDDSIDKRITQLSHFTLTKKIVLVLDAVATGKVEGVFVHGFRWVKIKRLLLERQRKEWNVLTVKF